jgi:hypothetical protein
MHCASLIWAFIQTQALAGTAAIGAAALPSVFARTVFSGLHFLAVHVQPVTVNTDIISQTVITNEIGCYRFKGSLTELSYNLFSHYTTSVFTYQ